MATIIYILACQDWKKTFPEGIYLFFKNDKFWVKIKFNEEEVTVLQVI